MVDLIDFPVTVLKLRSPAFTLAHATRPGQQATNGMRRSLGISGTAMRLSFTVFIGDVNDARAFRAFIMQMEADTQLVRIPLPDPYAIDGPFALATGAVRAEWPLGVPFETGAFYETGVGHAVPTLQAELSRAGGHHDRFIYVTATEDIPAGVYVSIDGFIYGIAGAWPSEGLGQKLRLSPVLRKAAAAGTVVDLAPVFVGFCTTELPGSEALDMGEWGEYSLSFTEDQTRLVETID
jgi:hypothetical protein